MERNYLMEVVCETTQSEDTQIRVAALQCLVKIMTLYYEYMNAYMGQALFPVSCLFLLILLAFTLKKYDFENKFYFLTFFNQHFIDYNGSYEIGC